MIYPTKPTPTHPSKSPPHPTHPRRTVSGKMQQQSISKFFKKRPTTAPSPSAAAAAASSSPGVLLHSPHHQKSRQRQQQQQQAKAPSALASPATTADGGGGSRVRMCVCLRSCRVLEVGGWDRLFSIPIKRLYATRFHHVRARPNAPVAAAPGSSRGRGSGRRAAVPSAGWRAEWYVHKSIDPIGRSTGRLERRMMMWS